MKTVHGLILAMPIEAYAVLGCRTRKQGKAFIYRSTHLDPDLELKCVCSGSGQNNVLNASHRLISGGVSSLILLGMSGGIRSDLRTGDIIVADSVIDTAGKGAFSCWKTDPSAVAFAHRILLETDLSCCRGAIATAGAPVIKAEAKKDLFAQTRALAVDMESAAVARAADEAGLSFFILRAVCDGPDTDLPAEITHCFDDEGNFQWRPLFEGIWGNPSFLPEIYAMSKRCYIALRSLKKVWHLQLEAGLPNLLAAADPHRYECRSS